MAQANTAFEFTYSDAYRWTAGDCPEYTGAVKDAGMAVVQALNDLHGHTAKFAESKFLSAEGAARLLAPHQEKVVAEAARQKRAVAAAAAELDAAEQRLFSPPALEPGDDVGGRSDERIYNWFNNLSPNELSTVTAEVQKGEHGDLVLALARSPVPGKAKAFGQTYWRGIVEKESGHKVREFETRRRAKAWAEGVLNVAPRVALSKPWSDKPVEGPLARLTRARSFMKPTSTA